ncbi:microviridin/marinostatin family tricyclic proteinase inhibitor [Burkholderia sp. MR1-5-21]
MSSIKTEDLSPLPFFAHFLESQFSKDLTREEMKAIRGGSVVTMAAPSDQEGVPTGELPDIQALIRDVTGRVSQLPGIRPQPVTLMYPSDGEIIPL